MIGFATESTPRQRFAHLSKMTIHHVHVDVNEFPPFLASAAAAAGRFMPGRFITVDGPEDVPKCLRFREMS